MTVPPRAEQAPFSSPEEKVKSKARALGFDAVGFARADEPLEQDYERYRDFIASGKHGEMGWLAANAEVRERLDAPSILEGAKSIVCLARRYQRSTAEEESDPETARALARYARGQDYHNAVRRQLRKLAAYLRTLGTEAEPIRARPICDDAPVLERAWAARAGLGFVGKNGLLIVPGVGSFVLLGEVVTNLRLIPDTPIAERCGSCTRCLDACPTQAFPRPFVLDARKCIAYLTIEQRSAIEAELRPAIGEHLFGCDDCQTVCLSTPRGRAREKRPRRSCPPEGIHAPAARIAPFLPLERWATVSVTSLLAVLDDADWEGVSRGSPVKRATREGLARNAAIVLGNRGESSALPSLRTAAATHPSVMVRDAATWAIARIESR